MASSSCQMMVYRHDVSLRVQPLLPQLLLLLLLLLQLPLLGAAAGNT